MKYVAASKELSVWIYKFPLGTPEWNEIPSCLWKLKRAGDRNNTQYIRICKSYAVALHIPSTFALSWPKFWLPANLLSLTCQNTTSSPVHLSAIRGRLICCGDKVGQNNFDPPRLFSRSFLEGSKSKPKWYARSCFTFKFANSKQH